MVRVIAGRTIKISDLKGKQKLRPVSRRFELSRVRVTEGSSYRGYPRNCSLRAFLRVMFGPADVPASL